MVEGPELQFGKFCGAAAFTSIESLFLSWQCCSLFGQTHRRRAIAVLRVCAVEGQRRAGKVVNMRRVHKRVS